MGFTSEQQQVGLSESKEHYCLSGIPGTYRDTCLGAKQMTHQVPTVYVSEPVSWEYKCLKRGLGEEALPTEDELNVLGRDGWELAAERSR